MRNKIIEHLNNKYEINIDEIDFQEIKNEVIERLEQGALISFSQNYEDIIANAEQHNLQHIYIGANMSFEADEAFDSMVFPLLKEGYWVTLDFDIKDVEWVLESGYTEYNRFIPMISAKLPYISQLGYNACLKLDDKDFDATNPGVWVHRMHDLKEKAVFTDWSKYTTDEIIG